MDNSMTTKTTSEIVIEEGAALGLATPTDVIKYITAMAEAAIEDEVEALHYMGQRPEGTYAERFRKAVIVELKAHSRILKLIK